MGRRPERRGESGVPIPPALAGSNGCSLLSPPPKALQISGFPPRYVPLFARTASPVAFSHQSPSGPPFPLSRQRAPPTVPFPGPRKRHYIHTLFLHPIPNGNTMDAAVLPPTANSRLPPSPKFPFRPSVLPPCRSLRLLQCVYHGWCFDGEGRCKSIPQEPIDGPKEKKIAEIGPKNLTKSCFVPTTSDALVVSYRRWLKKFANGHVDWGNELQSSLPSTPPREQLMDRYWSHVVQCTSCSRALKVIKALDVALQMTSARKCQRPLLTSVALPSATPDPYDPQASLLMYPSTLRSAAATFYLRFTSTRIYI